MKQLDSEADVSQTPGTANPRGSKGNVLFVTGLASAILLGAAGGGLYWYGTRLITPFDFEDQIVQVESLMDERPAWEIAQAFQALEERSKEGLGEWAELSYVRYNRQGEIIKSVSYGLLGLAAVGVVVLLSSFFFE